MIITRRRFLQTTGVLGAAAMMPRWTRRAFAATQGPGLSNPAIQPKFAFAMPNALDPSFIYDTSKGKIKVGMGQTVQMTGLKDKFGAAAATPL